MKSLNTLGLAHAFLRAHVQPGAFCIDATAGRGRDTAFLCSLAGPKGRVLAFDVQTQAIDSTQALLEKEGYSERARCVLDSHSHMRAYAQAESVDAIVFNFGYLPGGDHHFHTVPSTSITALEQGLGLLKPGGVMSLCIYYGGDTGFEERDALLAWLKTVDCSAFTVLVTEFHNRPNCPPIAVFILKEGQRR